MNLRSKDETGGDKVLPRGGIEELGTEDQKSIEPTTSLVDTLGNEVGGVCLVVTFNVLEWVVIRGVRHTLPSATAPKNVGASSPSRLEPTVKDFFNPLQLTLALLRRNGDVVDRLSVKILDAGDTRKLLQLSNRADADDL